MHSLQICVLTRFEFQAHNVICCFYLQFFIHVPVFHRATCMLGMAEKQVGRRFLILLPIFEPHHIEVWHKFIFIYSNILNLYFRTSITSLSIFTNLDWSKIVVNEEHDEGKLPMDESLPERAEIIIRSTKVGKIISFQCHNASVHVSSFSAWYYRHSATACHTQRLQMYKVRLT